MPLSCLLGKRGARARAAVTPRNPHFVTETGGCGLARTGKGLVAPTGLVLTGKNTMFNQQNGQLKIPNYRARSYVSTLHALKKKQKTYC